MACIPRAEEVKEEEEDSEDEVLGEEEEYDPYYLQLSRWVDLGEYQKEEESEEFMALTAGQVCCDNLLAQAPPIDCLWHGRNWSTIPSMRERLDGE